MSRRYQTLSANRARALNARAVGGIHELTATTGYQPAGPAGADRPDAWHCRPMHLAPFRCGGCSTPFHVRRHLEAHQCGADQGPDSSVVDRRHSVGLMNHGEGPPPTQPRSSQ